MSGEFEAAGAAITAGLAASAIEGREGHGEGDGVCLNCGATLGGPYCSQCGQGAHPHRTMAHMFEEALHGIVHFDTKAWRTLPMLAFRPGTLTRDYTYGKRARYISPLALFLFTIFLMFFVFAFVGASPVQVGAQSDVAEYAMDIEEARQDLATAQAELAHERASAPGANDIGARLAQVAVDGAQARIDQLEAARARELAGEAVAPESTGEDGVHGAGEPRWQDQLGADARSGELRIDTGWAGLDSRLRHALENPELALYKLQNTAYKFSFLLVPISLPFIWLLFIWRRGLTLYDHAVFVLYSLSFASLVFVFVTLAELSPWLSWAGGLAIFPGLPVHMFFHLKGAYALGWFSALWRTIFLLFFALLALVMFALAILALGLAG